MSGLQIERFGPYLSASAALLLWWWALDAPFPPKLDTLMAATGTVAAVLMGFLSTAKVIVLGLTGSEVFQRLKAAGYHNDLISYIRAAVYASMALFVISLAGLFLGPQNATGAAAKFVAAFPFIWIYCAALVAFMFLRVTNVLFKLVRQA